MQKTRNSVHDNNNNIVIIDIIVIHKSIISCPVIIIIVIMRLVDATQRTVWRPIQRGQSDRLSSPARQPQAAAFAVMLVCLPWM